MKTYKFAGLVLALIVLALLAAFCGGTAEAQTAPDFVAIDATGTVVLYNTVPGDREFHLFEITAGTLDSGISFWHQSTDLATITKLKPVFFHTATDTFIPVPAEESLVLRFTIKKPSFAFISGGSLTIKAE